jgi:hypothetical protein
MGAHMRIAIPLSLALLLSVQAAAQTAGAPPPPDKHIDTVTVTGPRDVEKAVNSFVKSYAKPTPLMGKFARWSAGSPLCPKAVGLSTVFNVFVSERIRTVAGMAGAPVQTKAPCTPNMVVLFTPHPQALLDAIRSSHTDLLGYHFVAQEKSLTTVSHPIQAWYATATRDYNGVLQVDDAQAYDDCLAINGGGIKALLACSSASMGTRLIDGEHSEMSTVTVVVDNAKIVGLPLGAVADYIAMLALSQTQAFETCQPLASIVNLMTPGCDVSLKPSELSQSDSAYLKALYKVNPDLLGQGQTSGIAHQMETALGGH